METNTASAHQSPNGSSTYGLQGCIVFTTDLNVPRAGRFRMNKVVEFSTLGLVCGALRRIGAPAGGTLFQQFSRGALADGEASQEELLERRQAVVGADDLLPRGVSVMRLVNFLCSSAISLMHLLAHEYGSINTPLHSHRCV